MPGKWIATIAFVLLVANAAAFAQEDAALRIQWRRGPDLPQAVGGPAFGALDGKLVIAGGTFWPDENTKLWLAKAYAYDPAANAWSDLPDLPKGVGYACAVSTADALYVFGGQPSKTENSRQTWRLVRKDDAYAWDPFVPLPVPLCNMQAALVGTTAYLVAGESGAPKPKADSKVWKINLASDAPKWEACAPLPGPARTGVATTACAGRVYAYDPQTDAWSRIKDVPYPARWWWACTYAGRYIILPGGIADVKTVRARFPGMRINDDGFIADVLVYDTTTNAYSFAGSLEKGIIDYGLVPVGNTVYLAGGEDRGKHRASWFLIGALTPVRRD